MRLLSVAAATAALALVSAAAFVATPPDIAITSLKASHGPPSSWASDAVGRLLRATGFPPDVSDEFEAQGVLGGMLLALDDADLAQLGVAGGLQRKRWTALVAALHADEAAPHSAAPAAPASTPPPQDANDFRADMLYALFGALISPSLAWGIARVAGGHIPSLTTLGGAMGWNPLDAVFALLAPPLVSVLQLERTPFPFGGTSGWLLLNVWRVVLLARFIQYLPVMVFRLCEIYSMAPHGWVVWRAVVPTNVAMKEALVLAAAWLFTRILPRWRGLLDPMLLGLSLFALTGLWSYARSLYGVIQGARGLQAPQQARPPQQREAQWTSGVRPASADAPVMPPQPQWQPPSCAQGVVVEDAEEEEELPSLVLAPLTKAERKRAARAAAARAAAAAVVVSSDPCA